jgi:hypothetical protein
VSDKPSIRVRALLRTATDAEITEALERNPGSSRLRAAGYQPAWFQLDVDVDDDEAGDRQFGVIWAEPGMTRDALAREELELALEAALQGLRDFEGVDVEREDIPDDAIELVLDD